MHKEIDISDRFKQLRDALGYTQTGIAEAIDSKLRSWQEYEKGARIPGSQVIAGLVRLGVNANWVLTGEGEMLIADIKGKTPDTLDEALLKTVIEAMEEAAIQMDIEFDPHKKAEIILAIYHMYHDAKLPANKSNIIKFVKSAA